MKGKWKVSHNYAGGEKLIQVYRQLDVNDVDHAGNREYQPGFFETDEEAQALADSLNTKHWKIKVIRRWDMEGIMHMCINHNFYTRGDTRAYTKMLNYVKQKEPTPEEIYIVAVDILDHTDENEDQSITNIIYIIENEVVRTAYEIEWREGQGMSDAKIKVIIKRPDEKAGHVTNISASLKNLQKTVEGNIETVTVVLDPKVIMICNEEGKIQKLQKNFRMGGEIFFDIIRGTVIICGESEDGEDFADVPIDFETWKRYLKAWGNEI